MTLLTMAVLGAVCWVVRVLFILVVPADRLPRRVRRSLTCLAPATMASLVAVQADAAVSGGSAAVTGTVLVALLATAVVARSPRGLLLTVAVATTAALVLDLVLLS